MPERDILKLLRMLLECRAQVAKARSRKGTFNIEGMTQPRKFKSIRREVPSASQKDRDGLPEPTHTVRSHFNGLPVFEDLGREIGNFVSSYANTPSKETKLDFSSLTFDLTPPGLTFSYDPEEDVTVVRRNGAKKGAKVEGEVLSLLLYIMAKSMANSGTAFSAEEFDFAVNALTTEPDVPSEAKTVRERARKNRQRIRNPLRGTGILLNYDDDKGHWFSIDTPDR